MSDSNELLILKKRLQNCKTAKGSLTNIPDDLLLDVIHSWERWTGTSKAFYTAIGLNKNQIGSVIKKGKKVLKDGGGSLGPFTPIQIKTPVKSSGGPIVLNWSKTKTIKFYDVAHLVEFLKLYRDSYSQNETENLAA